jgi:hypothetical protein
MPTRAGTRNCSGFLIGRSFTEIATARIYVLRWHQSSIGDFASTVMFLEKNRNRSVTFKCLKVDFQRQWFLIHRLNF